MRETVHHLLTAIPTDKSLPPSGETSFRPAIDALEQLAADDEIQAVAVVVLKRDGNFTYHYNWLPGTHRGAFLGVLHSSVSDIQHDLFPPPKNDPE